MDSMMEDAVQLPPITIIMTTWFQRGEIGERRAQVARESITSWARHLKYDGPLALHIADDGTEMVTMADFATSWAYINMADNYFPPAGASPPQRSHQHLISITESRQERKGVGASLNAGIAQAVKISPLFMYVVDDWVLDYDLDLTPWAKLLIHQPEVGMVRLGPPHPWVAGRFCNYPDGWALIQDFDHFCFSFRPALFHHRFIEAYGYFKEGESSLECERFYNLEVCNIHTKLIVYAITYPWRHIGSEDGGELSAIKPGEAPIYFAGDRKLHIQGVA